MIWRLGDRVIRPHVGKFRVDKLIQARRQLFFMTEQEIRLLLRITARASFLLFSVAFTADAALALWPTKVTEWLARNRDGFFLGFVASHTVHLGAVIALALQTKVPIARLIPGGLVYLLIYALTAAVIARSLGRRQLAFFGSPGFESFAMNLVWLVFASAFVPRIMKNASYSVLGVLAVAALLVRIAGRTRKARPAAA